MTMIWMERLSIIKGALFSNYIVGLVAVQLKFQKKSDTITLNSQLRTGKNILGNFAK